MSNPYVGEIRMFAGNFAPVGWMLCQGQTLPIAENEVLFQLIGTTYGGDGEETFNLPDLASRVPVHAGTGPGLSTRMLGEQSGVESVTLSIQQIPTHNHALLASTEIGTNAQPQGGHYAQVSTGTLYNEAFTPFANMNTAMATPVGGSQPHENLQPYLALNFIISLFGVFPHT